MGWSSSSSWQDKTTIVDLILHASFWHPQVQVINHRTNGNHLWMLVFDSRDNSRTIELALLHKFDEGWGYKIIDETCGPTYYDCPLSFLNQCTEPKNNYAKEWREKVRRDAESNALRRNAYTPGLLLKVGNATYRLVEYLGRLGWNVVNVGNNLTYRMPCKVLKQARIQSESVTKLAFETLEDKKLAVQGEKYWLLYLSLNKYQIEPDDLGLIALAKHTGEDKDLLRRSILLYLNRDSLIERSNPLP